MSADTTTTVHLAELDGRLHRPWREQAPANVEPGTCKGALPRTAAVAPPCVEPTDPWHYGKGGERHPFHVWEDASAHDGAYADVAPGTYYHERCANCGLYRTCHSRQRQPEGGLASYNEYYEWGTCPPFAETSGRNRDAES